MAVKPPGDDGQQRAYPNAKGDAPQETVADVDLPHVRSAGRQEVAPKV